MGAIIHGRGEKFKSIRGEAGTIDSRKASIVLEGNKMTERFPWPPPPRTLVPTDPGPEIPFAERAEIIRWFCRVRGGGQRIPEGSPLDQLVTKMSAVLYTSSGKNTAVPTGDKEHDLKLVRDLVDLAEFQMLVWAIRVVETQPAGRVDIKPEFVTNDLFQPDLAKNYRHTGPRMPRGVHTIGLAGRLIHATPGRVVVHGKTSQGKDIEWWPETGGLLWIERKDRAFRAAFDDTADSFWHRVEVRTLEAVKGMPRNVDAGRMVVFGGFRPTVDEAIRIRDSFQKKAMSFDWSEVPDSRTPDVVAIEPWAIGSVEGAYKPEMYPAIVETKASRSREAYQVLVPAMKTAFGNHRVEFFPGLDITTRARQAELVVGRNAPCPCGSGEKFKKCCGRS